MFTLHTVPLLPCSTGSDGNNGGRNGESNETLSFRRMVKGLPENNDCKEGSATHDGAVLRDHHKWAA